VVIVGNEDLKCLATVYLNHHAVPHRPSWRKRHHL